MKEREEVVEEKREFSGYLRSSTTCCSIRFRVVQCFFETLLYSGVQEHGRKRREIIVWRGKTSVVSMSAHEYVVDEQVIDALK